MNRQLDEPALLALGARLAGRLPAGSILWLEGELGAGKTTLARGIVRARGADQGATSPTFALSHRYLTSRGPVFHVDCYRFRDEEEASALDWSELVSGDLLIIEWPDRGGSWVPPATHRLRLGHLENPDLREVVIVPDPAEWLDG